MNPQALLHLHHHLLRANQIDRLRYRLLARIAKRYRAVQDDIRVGSLKFPFWRIENPDAVLDLVAAEIYRDETLHGKRKHGDDLHLPYWAQLWDSGAGVGEFLVGAQGRSLLTRWGVIEETNILDLGCGMGLSGAVAARLGVKVLFADLEPHALLFARLNTLEQFETIRARKLNWRTDDLHEQFHLILGADILYERAQWKFLDAFWKKHLAKAGAVILGEPGRPTGDGFIDWIADKGWRFEQFKLAVDTQPKPVRVFKLERG
jgi:predicted nicotinamide N-methyase